MYLFGSQLAKKLFPKYRNPNDTDWVTNNINEFNSLPASTKEVEYYYNPCTPNREMTANELYTLKVSHAIYDIKWSKTMSDIRFFQINGCKIDKEFLKDLREHWATVHTGKKRTNFEVEENMFFKDNVRREIEHDDLHLLVNPNPAYKNIVDGVKPIEEKFFNLNTQQKFDVCVEEAYVLAYERYSHLQMRLAYFTAQQDLVTRLHPIWLADYVIENWNNSFWVCKTDYREIIENNLNKI